MTRYLRLMLAAAILFGGAFLGYGTLRDSDFLILPAADPAQKTMRPAEPEPVRLIALGDVMLGRYVRTLMETEGRDYPFRRILEFLSEADLVWANLEGPVVRNAPPTPLNSLKFAFTEEVPELLAAANITVAALGNNHALDQGPEGYAESKELLLAAGVGAHGHPARIPEAALYARSVKGIELQLLSFNATWPSSFKKEESVAAVRDAARNGPVLVMIHWGEEYEPLSNETQRDLAHSLIDAGALAIFGHHPHVVQEIGTYRGRAIFYSLGNFIFDQYFSEETQEGFAVRIELGPEPRYELFPYRIIRSQPELMPQAEAETWLQELAERSSPEIAEGIRRGTFSLTRE